MGLVIGRTRLRGLFLGGRRHIFFYKLTIVQDYFCLIYTRPYLYMRLYSNRQNELEVEADNGLFYTEGLCPKHLYIF